MNPLFIPKETKDELNTLCKELFGRKNIWLKFLRKGVPNTIEWSTPTRPGSYPKPLKAEIKRFTPQSLLDYLKKTKADLNKPNENTNS